MLRYFVVFVVLVGLSVFITSQHEKYADNATHPAQQDSSAVVAANDTEQPKSNAKDTKWYAPSGNIAFLVFGFPNGITVWALFLTLMVIAEQTRETRNAAEATKASVVLMKRQVELMDQQAKDARASADADALTTSATLAAIKQQADAALNTVQVMIDSERPWIVAHMDQAKRSCILNGGAVRFTWTVKNVGKSPARLIEAGAMASLDTLGPPIDQIQYKMEALEGKLLVPGDSAPLFVFWSIIENGAPRYHVGKSADEFNDFAMVYGCVRYQGVIGTQDVYESRFSESSTITSGVCDGFEANWPVNPEDIRCT